MKVRKRHSLNREVHLLPGDKLICTITEKGEEFTVVEDIGREVVVDMVVTFDIEESDAEALGLTEGIGGVFGKSV
jgi:hypothetical protein